MGNVISTIVSPLISAILNLIYLLWLGGAWIIGVIEDIFLMFVGLNPVYKVGTAAGEVAAGREVISTNDITAMILNNRHVQEIFTNLVAFATIMLIFFTILQIIREHYKDKNGGNPYVLVFRMVKAMVLFMFVTAACIVGLQLSNVVLRALYAATGGSGGGIGGTIFVAMAGSANRVAQAGQGANEIDDKNLYAAVINHSADPKNKEWIWFEKLPEIWYGCDPAIEEANTGMWWWADARYTDSTLAEQVDSNVFSITGLSNVPSDYRTYEVIRFDTSDLNNVIEYHWANSWLSIDEIRSGHLPMFILDGSGASKLVARYGGNKNISNQHKGFIPVNAHYSDSTDNGGDYHYYAITTDERGKPLATTLRQYGKLAGSYFYLEAESDIGSVGQRETLFSFYQRTELGYSGSGIKSFNSFDQTQKNAYANWIDGLMKRRKSDQDGKKDVPQALMLYNDQSWFNKHQAKGAIRYTNPNAVNALYSIFDFNWIIGFGGLFVALGVYNSFAFGMIQRIAELGILYMFSPVTLAFFPFDDGAQFNNSFVKPFYKKAISSFAPVLSLNLFFVILPAFDSIIWFDPQIFGAGVLNTITNCLVTIALLSMLPKVRTTIQTMMGADPMEEKKFFGKGGVMENARKTAVNAIKTPAENLQKLGQAAKFHANRVVGAKAKKEKARLAEADRLAKGLGLDDKEKAKLSEKGLIKGRLSAARRAAARAQLNKKELNADLAAQGVKGGQQKGLAGVANRMQQRGRNMRKSEAAYDEALEAAKNGDFTKLNANRNFRQRAFRELGASLGLQGSALDEFVNERMRGKDGKATRFNEKHLKLARDGGGKYMGMEAKGGKLQTRADVLKSELDKEFESQVASEKASLQAKADKQAQDKISKQALARINASNSLKMKYGTLVGKENGENLTQDDWDAISKHKDFDSDLAKMGINKKDITGKITDAEAEASLRKKGIVRKQATPEAVRARAVSDKQKRLDKKYLESEKTKEFFKANKDKAWAQRFFKDGKLLEGDDLVEEFYTAAGEDSQLRSILKVPTATAEGIKGRIAGFGQGAKNFGSTLVNPWKMVDTFNEKMQHLRSRPTFFGSIMDGLFDPDNGIMMQGEFAKLMDGFSYSKTFQSLNKWEEGKSKRTNDEAFAKGRALRFAGQYGATAQERADINESIAFRANAMAETAEGARIAIEGQDGKGGLKKQAVDAEQSIADIITGVNSQFKSVIDKALEGYEQGTPQYDAQLKKINNVLNQGQKDDFALFGAKGAEIYEARETHVFKNEKVMKDVEEHRRIISDYEKALGMARDDKGEWQSQADFVKAKQKRLSQLDEYDGNAARILNISPADQAELRRVLGELTDPNGKYISAKRDYEAKKNPVVEIEGKMVTLDSAAAFSKFQKYMYAEYEKVVNNKVDYHAVAFRDYGEKTGDRLDGILGATMASEQVKLMQDTIWKTDKNTHQLFRDPKFVEMVQNSQWQTLADQFTKASQGQENVFDKTLLAGVTKKSELADIGNMFKNMLGDADGEMRGGGFTVANNIIARTFRMAFVDQITEALKVTGGMLDQMQVQAQNLRNASQDELTALKNSGKLWEKEVMKGINVQNIGESAMTGQELDAMQARMLKQHEDTVKKYKVGEVEANEMRQKILQLFAQEMKDRNLRNETNLMNWRIRELNDLDFIARNMVDRKDDKRA